ncbi:mCG1044576 [Mus musculus]|nr:mCG1044576 [Mus musculus]
MALLEYVWPCWRNVSLCRWTSRTPTAKAPPSAENQVSSWLPSDQVVELSAPPAPCLPAGCHVSCPGDNGLNL